MLEVIEMTQYPIHKCIKLFWGAGTKAVIEELQREKQDVLEYLMFLMKKVE